jgi:hypothetical protein
VSGPWLRRPCDVPWLPHGLLRARLYPAGWRCNRHTPNAIRGLPEAPSGLGLPADLPLSPISDSRVHDARAIASGKQRSSPQAYRAAQAAVGHRPDPATDLRVDLGQRDAKNHRWIRYPTADYICPACHETESASGDQVAHFAAHIETEHQQRCTANPQGAQD